jgi:Sterol carrier protein domain
VKRASGSFAQNLERRGRVRLVMPEEAKELMPPVWEALRAQRPGMFSRSDAWWAARLHPRRAGYWRADALWLRLVDVGAALSGRRYAHDGAVVFDVRDGFCSWNEGRWKLVDGRAERTEEPAELVLDVDALGSAYLGAVSFAQLRDAFRVEELVDGACGAGRRAVRLAPVAMVSRDLLAAISPRPASARARSVAGRRGRRARSASPRRRRRRPSGPTRSGSSRSASRRRRAPSVPPASTSASAR